MGSQPRASLISMSGHLRKLSARTKASHLDLRGAVQHRVVLGMEDSPQLWGVSRPQRLGMNQEPFSVGRTCHDLHTT